MANRAHLVVSPLETFWDGEALGLMKGARGIAGAGWKIPPLWYSLFAVSDLGEVRYFEEEEEISWPYLTTSLDSACQRAREHRASFLSIFTDQQALYDQWTGYFERLATSLGGYIHIKTYDVSDLWDDAVFNAYLIACMEAFAHNRWEDWLVLLRQSGLEYEPGPPIRILTDSRVRDIGGILCGYSESDRPDFEWPGFH